ncbi:MAG: ChbG/HpnK family deacetylase [Armatimonadota bacterium]
MNENRARIAFRADDAGSCESANLAIAEGIGAGTVKNVSVMACGPAIEHAVSLLKDQKHINLGLHVTLNAEWETVKWGPVLPDKHVPSLLEPGTDYFTASPRVLGERGFSLEEAVAEATAQLARARSLGLEIHYLDEHMGVGSLPGLRSALAELCHREGLLQLSTLNLLRLPAADNKDLVERWLSALRNAKDGDYLVVTHPGRIAPDMESFYERGGVPGAVAQERDAERRALADDSLRAGLAALGMESVRFTDLSAGQ